MNHRHRLITLLLLLLLPLVLNAQQGSPVRRIVLIGDAGEPDNSGNHPVERAVLKHVPMDENTTVVYLGDNLYRHGLPDEQLAIYTYKRAILDSQMAIADKTRGMVYLIPGNHDWQNGQPNGFGAILRQGRYVNGAGKKNLRFLPQNGCPGPELVNISDDVVLIIMDSQWWIHAAAKPGIESDCNCKTEQEILSQLSDMLAENYGKLVIFACHHPFRSNGEHGGYYTLKQHIFPFTDIKKNLYIPLPVLGSIYPISRSVFGTPQDLKHPVYANMVAQVDAVLREHPNVIRVAGHEHALQWITDSNNNYLVSGSGCKNTRVSTSRKSKFVSPSQGFALLDVYANKDVRCTFWSSSTDPDSTQKPLYSDLMLNFGKLPQQKGFDTVMPVAAYKDTVIVPASHQYEKTSAFKRFVQGSNYRKVWSAPVAFKTFNMRKLHGGMRITGTGGGKQTKSLTLRDASGRYWKLRTIDKDPEKAVPPNLRNTVAQAVVQDMISAAHPYAPLIVPVLAAADSIPHSNPTFYYIQDDPAFGKYREVFRNKVCLLEEADASWDGSDTKSTATVFNKMIDEGDHLPDQRATAHARLLDMLLADWDRHFDQWHWGINDTGKGRLYYPIPRDRDQAMFRSNGALIFFATRQQFLPWMKGFKPRVHGLKWLARSARDFDRIFMNGLDRDQWAEITLEFCNHMTDAVIDSAVRRLPPEIYAIDGPEITATLKSRRDQMRTKALKYHRFISKYVNVLGSNREEYFTVKGNDSGILVQIYARDKKEDTSFRTYSRQFYSNETKEVRLWGFNGADNFYVDKDVHSPIALRIIGGRGADTFNLQGRIRSFLYDLSYEKNDIVRARRTRYRLTSNPQVNEFSVNDFNYNITKFPSINLGYNPEDGVLAGIGYRRRSYGFRKDPYKTDNALTTLVAIGARAYQVRYQGTFIGLINNYDLLLHGWVQNPSLNNFFGYGNETERSEASLPYYRTRYSFATADALIQRRFFGEKVALAIGPYFYYYWNNHEDNVGKILEQPAAVGLDSASIFRKKTYFGGRTLVTIDNLNSDLFPTRGINWTTELISVGGMNGNSRNFTALRSDMSVYASLSDPARLVALLRLGGGHIFSREFEYFQAMGIGQNNYLRGFRKNRFTGRSMAYGSLELRAKLFDIKSAVLPGAFGLVGFDDVARVWADGENSNRWHNSIGAGFYYIPYNLVIISATGAFTGEETLVNVTIGTKLNLTF